MEGIQSTTSTSRCGQTTALLAGVSLLVTLAAVILSKTQTAPSLRKWCSGLAKVGGCTTIGLAGWSFWQCLSKTQGGSQPSTGRVADCNDHNPQVDRIETPESQAAQAGLTGDQVRPGASLEPVSQDQPKAGQEDVAFAGALEQGAPIHSSKPTAALESLEQGAKSTGRKLRELDNETTVLLERLKPLKAVLQGGGEIDEKALSSCMSEFSQALKERGKLLMEASREQSRQLEALLKLASSPQQPAVAIPVQ